MSSREMFDLEPGDTGEALLPAVGKPACSAASGTQAYPEHASADAEANKVNDKGAHLRWTMEERWVPVTELGHRLEGRLQYEAEEAMEWWPAGGTFSNGDPWDGITHIEREVRFVTPWKSS